MLERAEILHKYFENKTATKETGDADGYFKTGDVRQLGAHTRLIYVIERTKEMIKAHGVQDRPG